MKNKEIIEKVYRNLGIPDKDNNFKKHTIKSIKDLKEFLKEPIEKALQEKDKNFQDFLEELKEDLCECDRMDEGYKCDLCEDIDILLKKHNLLQNQKKGCGKLFNYKRKGLHITGACGDTGYTDGFIPLCPECEKKEKEE